MEIKLYLAYGFCLFLYFLCDFFFFFFCSVSIGYFGVAWLLRAGWIGMEREKKKCNWKHRSRFCCRVSQNVPFCIAIEINLWMAGLTLTCACFLPFTTRWKWNVYSFCCSLVDMIITSLPSCRSPCWLVSGDSQVDIRQYLSSFRGTQKVIEAKRHSCIHICDVFLEVAGFSFQNLI